jgi:hypothetical protein
MKPMNELNPNLKFLQKVADGKVYSFFSYSPRTGWRYGFNDDEVTYEKHLAAGFVTNRGRASLVRRGSVRLTPKGKEALESGKTQ